MLNLLSAAGAEQWERGALQKPKMPKFGYLDVYQEISVQQKIHSKITFINVKSNDIFRAFINSSLVSAWWLNLGY